MCNVRLNSCFKEINKDHEHRYKLYMGGAGSGKSYNVARLLMIRLSTETQSNLLVVRSSDTANAHSTKAELLKAIDDMGLSTIWVSYKNMILNRNTKQTIQFRGVNNAISISRLKSITAMSGIINYVWIEEATEISREHFNIIDDRLRGGGEGTNFQVFMTFNPISAYSWIKTDLWDSNENSAVLRSKTTYRDNSFIDTQYADRMERRRLTDPNGYAVYAMGEWGDYEGVVFKNYEIGDYSSNAFTAITGGIDWGYNHASVALVIGWIKETPYIIFEHYATEQTTDEFISEMQIKLSELKIPKTTIFYCDSAEPDRIKTAKKLGIRAYPVSKETNSINNQIVWLQNRKMYVNATCFNLVKELQTYSYIKDNKSGDLLDIYQTTHDDCIAALRYGIEPIRKQNKITSISKRGFI